MIKYLPVALLIILSGLFPHLNSQDYNLTGFNNDCFLKMNEKVYVQLEKYVFIPGEPLKYKVYVVNASTLNKSLNSKVVYFEILGHYGQVFSWRANLDNGMGNGMVIIPDSISGGVYTLRAYTNWMRNISPEFLFSTRIIITKISEPGLDKLYGPNLTSADAVDSLSLQNPNQSEYDLSVENIWPDKYIVNITRNIPDSANPGMFRLVILLRGQTLNNIPLTINESVTKVSVSKSTLSEGIFNIILINPYNVAVCEKLAYIPSENSSSLNINTSKNIYGKNEKVVMELTLNNMTQSDTAWLSIAVTENNPAQSILNNAGISSYLSFYSEISGYSHLSDLPLSISDKQANKMLQTISPDKYIWNYASEENDRPCKYIMENKGFVMSGRILKQAGGPPLKNKLVILSSADSLASIKYCYTDSNGNFYFLPGQSYDNRDLILQIINNNDEGENIWWEIDKKSLPLAEIGNNYMPVSHESEEYLEHCREMVLINNIYKENTETGEINEIPTALTDHRNFCGKPDYVIYPSDYVELKDFREISQNILMGVRFRGKTDNYHVKIFDPVNEIAMPAKATVLLNGVPFNDLNYISTLGSKDIKQIDVYQTELLYGELTFYGILSIYTFDCKIPDTYLNNYAYVYKNKVLPSVVFPEKNIEQTGQNDIKNRPCFRQTLFWEPSLRVQRQNKVTVVFNTSELKGEYKIIVQGLTSGGIPLEATSEIEVK